MRRPGAKPHTGKDGHHAKDRPKNEGDDVDNVLFRKRALEARRIYSRVYDKRD